MIWRARDICCTGCVPSDLRKLTQTAKCTESTFKDLKKRKMERSLLVRLPMDIISVIVEFLVPVHYRAEMTTYDDIRVRNWVDLLMIIHIHPKFAAALALSDWAWTRYTHACDASMASMQMCFERIFGNSSRLHRKFGVCKTRYTGMSLPIRYAWKKRLQWQPGTMYGMENHVDEDDTAEEILKIAKHVDLSYLPQRQRERCLWMGGVRTLHCKRDQIFRHKRSNEDGDLGHMKYCDELCELVLSCGSLSFRGAVVPVCCFNLANVAVMNLTNIKPSEFVSLMFKTQRLPVLRTLELTFAETIFSPIVGGDTNENVFGWEQFALLLTVCSGLEGLIMPLRSVTCQVSSEIVWPVHESLEVLSIYGMWDTEFRREHHTPVSACESSLDRVFVAMTGLVQLRLNFVNDVANSALNEVMWAIGQCTAPLVDVILESHVFAHSPLYTNWSTTALPEELYRVTHTGVRSMLLATAYTLGEFGSDTISKRVGWLFPRVESLQIGMLANCNATQFVRMVETMTNLKRVVLVMTEVMGRVVDAFNHMRKRGDKLDYFEVRGVTDLHSDERNEGTDRLKRQIMNVVGMLDVAKVVITHWGESMGGSDRGPLFVRRIRSCAKELGLDYKRMVCEVQPVYRLPNISGVSRGVSKYVVRLGVDETVSCDTIGIIPNRFKALVNKNRRSYMGDNEGVMW